MRIAIWIVVSLVLTWGLVLAILALWRPKGIDYRAAKALLPDLARLVRDLARDPSTGRSVRIRLYLLVLYLLSPIDLVPDFVPLLGYADDVIVVVIVLRSVVRAVGENTLDDLWKGSPEGLEHVKRLVGLKGPA